MEQWPAGPSHLYAGRWKCNLLHTNCTYLSQFLFASRYHFIVLLLRWNFLQMCSLSLPLFWNRNLYELDFSLALVFLLKRCGPAANSFRYLRFCVHPPTSTLECFCWASQGFFRGSYMSSCQHKTTLDCCVALLFTTLYHSFFLLHSFFPPPFPP